MILPISETGLGLLFEPNKTENQMTYKSGHIMRTIIHLAFLKCFAVASNYNSAVSFFRLELE